MSCVLGHNASTVYFQPALRVLHQEVSDNYNDEFLVGAFLVKRARLLQWLVFFRQTTILTLTGPLFLQQKLLKLLRPKAKSGQRKLSAKGPPFHFYFFKETYQTGRA